MNFDVVIVGAGPSGLTMGIRLAQLAQQQERELTICILEKGAEVGAHILSGAVVDPRGVERINPRLEGKGGAIERIGQVGSVQIPDRIGLDFDADPAANA